MVLTGHTIQTVLGFMYPCLDGVQWLRLADGIFTDAQEVLCTLLRELRVKIDGVRILFIMYRYGFDLNLGLLGHFRAA